jgi:hypothetical protein
MPAEQRSATKLGNIFRLFDLGQLNWLTEPVSTLITQVILIVAKRNWGTYFIRHGGGECNVEYILRSNHGTENRWFVMLIIEHLNGETKSFKLVPFNFMHTWLCTWWIQSGYCLIGQSARWVCGTINVDPRKLQTVQTTYGAGNGKFGKPWDFWLQLNGQRVVN